MKESILDVLLYLFEHYFTNDAISVDGDDLTAQNGPLMGELTEAGFSTAEIRRARPVPCYTAWRPNFSRSPVRSFASSSGPTSPNPKRATTFAGSSRPCGGNCRPQTSS